MPDATLCQLWQHLDGSMWIRKSKSMTCGQATGWISGSDHLDIATPGVEEEMRVGNCQCRALD